MPEPAAQTPTRAAIALGSNLGDRMSYMRGAVGALAGLGTVVAVSPLYETAPVGGPEQGPYLNAVAVLETTLPARVLLDELHGIERVAGRTREVRWGPRTLDLDLILYGDAAIHDERGLDVPHPRYRDRRFVVEPLIAAWPDAIDPDAGPIAPLLDALEGQELQQVQGRDWAVSRSEVSGRGGAWVAGQIVFLLVHVLGLTIRRPLLTGSPGGYRAVAVLLAVGAGALFALSCNPLGRMLTPYPQPVEGGELVRSGIYGRVRHPMYGAVLLLAFAAVAWTRSLTGLITGIALILFFEAKARHEERRLDVAYPDYALYREQVPRRFIPWVL